MFYFCSTLIGKYEHSLYEYCVTAAICGVVHNQQIKKNMNEGHM